MPAHITAKLALLLPEDRIVDIFIKLEHKNKHDFVLKLLPKIPENILKEVINNL